MNSTQSNKTARFRFLIKYLKLKVVLQIVYSVSLLLAPKLIFFASKSELLFTNLKTLHLDRVAMMYTLLSLDTLIPLSSLTCYLSEISGNLAIAVECEIIVILASFGATSFPPLLERQRSTCLERSATILRDRLLKVLLIVLVRRPLVT